MQQLVMMPGPCTVCPHCGGGVPQASGSPVFVYGVGPVGHQVCPSCGTRWQFRYKDPNADSAKAQRRNAIMLLVSAAVLAAGIMTVAGVILVHRGSGSSYPKQWDAQVAPIAARVESLRALTFKHPVRVNYLSVTAFEKKVTASPADLRKARAQIEAGTALLRAVGLVGANVDLAAAVNTTEAADTDAFYDDKTKQIYIRGTDFTVHTRVTLAHELTHVLQDQYFDLTKLSDVADKSKTGSSEAFTALIEGDATRIQDRYLAEQSAAERTEYEHLDNAASTQADQRTTRLPAIVEVEFGAPYVFGPHVIEVLENTGGNAAINTAISGPTPSTRIYLDPTNTHDTADAPPPLPTLRPDEKKLTTKLGNDDNFDNFSLYLMLAARLDAPTALLAADTYRSGSEILYTSHGATCLRATIETITPDSQAYLTSVIRRWTRTLPDAAIDTTEPAVTFHSCDPGPRATTPNDNMIRQATNLAANRDAITATFTKLHIDPPIAACAARVLMQQPDFRDAVLRNAQPTAHIRQESVNAGIACRTNQLAGLPGLS